MKTGPNNGSSSNPNTNPSNPNPLQQEENPQLELTLAPPSMEDPGQSSVIPPSQPSRSSPPPPGPIGGAAAIGIGFQGFQCAQAIPVEGSGGGVHAAPPLRMGAMLGRKRGPEGAVAGPVAGGAGAGGEVFNCSVCGKSFSSNKALFGHMRSHPDRGWRGTHRPPAFNAEDEFADIRAMQREQELEAAGGACEEGPEGEEEEEEEERAESGEQRNPPLADLNLPPPPEEEE